MRARVHVHVALRRSPVHHQSRGWVAAGSIPRLEMFVSYHNSQSDTLKGSVSGVIDHVPESYEHHYSRYSQASWQSQSIRSRYLTALISPLTVHRESRLSTTNRRYPHATCGYLGSRRSRAKRQYRQGRTLRNPCLPRTAMPSLVHQAKSDRVIQGRP